LDSIVHISGITIGHIVVNCRLHVTINCLHFHCVYGRMTYCS